MSVSGAFAQGSRMDAWGEDRHYEEPDAEDEEELEPDPDEAYEQMRDERDEERWL